MYGWFGQRRSSALPASFRSKLGEYLIPLSPGQTTQYFHLSAALAVCRLTGIYCSEENFSSVCHQLEHQFNEQKQKQAQVSLVPVAEVVSIDSDTDDHQRKRRKRSNVSDENLSPNTKQRNRQRMLRRLHQICKPLTDQETQEVVSDAGLAQQTIQCQAEYIELLKCELADDSCISK